MLICIFNVSWDAIVRGLVLYKQPPSFAGLPNGAYRLAEPDDTTPKARFAIIYLCVGKIVFELLTLLVYVW